jgi:TRAP-type C4-dicarboxylate transport system permease small subunit
MTTSSTTAAMMLPYGFINSALFVGFTFMLIHLLTFIVGDITGFLGKKSQSAAA